MERRTCRRPRAGSPKRLSRGSAPPHAKKNRTGPPKVIARQHDPTSAAKLAPPAKGSPLRNAPSHPQRIGPAGERGALVVTRSPHPQRTRAPRRKRPSRPHAPPHPQGPSPPDQNAVLRKRNSTSEGKLHRSLQIPRSKRSDRTQLAHPPNPRPWRCHSYRRSYSFRYIHSHSCSDRHNLSEA